MNELEIKQIELRIKQTIQQLPTKHSYTEQDCEEINKWLQTRFQSSNVKVDSTTTFKISVTKVADNIEVVVCETNNKIKISQTLKPFPESSDPNEPNQMWSNTLAGCYRPSIILTIEAMTKAAEIYRLVSPYTNYLTWTTAGLFEIGFRNHIYKEILVYPQKEVGDLEFDQFFIREWCKTIPEKYVIASVNIKDYIMKDKRIYRVLSAYSTVDSSRKHGRYNRKLAGIEERAGNNITLLPLGKFLWNVLHETIPLEQYCNADRAGRFASEVKHASKEIIEVEPVCFNCQHWNNGNNDKNGEIACFCKVTNRQTLSCETCREFSATSAAKMTKDPVFFRLDPLFGNPCSLCRNNRNEWNRSFYGIPIVCSKMRLVKPKQLSTRQMQTCPNFILDIEKLKTVVYGGMTFSSSFAYISKIDRSGMISSQWDPFWYMYYTISRVLREKQVRNVIGDERRIAARKLTKAIDQFVQSGKNKSNSSEKGDFESMQMLALSLNKLWAEIVLGRSLDSNRDRLQFEGLIDVFHLYEK